MKHIYLKTVQPFYDEVESGNKPFEARFNDRDYQVGDILHLQEFIPPETFTGKEIVKRATYILDDPKFCKEGYVIIGIEDVKIPDYSNTSVPLRERIKILEKALINKSQKLEALREKQKPKRVVFIDGSHYAWKCPECGAIAHNEYCEKCGQKLSWEGAEND